MQEIGPRFTLKLRWLRKGLPAVKNLGQPSKPLEFDTFDDEEDAETKDAEMQNDEDNDVDESGEPISSGETSNVRRTKVVPPTEDEYLWIWKVDHLIYFSFRFSTNRRFS